MNRPSLVLRDRGCEEGHEGYSFSAYTRALGRTGAGKTTPEVIGGIDGAGAEVINADLVAEQIIEVQIHLCRGVDDDILSLVFDDVCPDDGAGDGRTATAAVEVNACRAGSRCVADIGAVPGDVVADDDVVVEVVGRQAERWTDMAVEGYSGKAIVTEFIVDDDVCRDGTDAAAVGEDANTCTGAWNQIPIVDGLVVDDRVVNDAEVRGG